MSAGSPSEVPNFDTVALWRLNVASTEMQAAETLGRRHARHGWTK